MNRKTLSLADWQQQQQPENTSKAPAAGGKDLVYSTDGGSIQPEKAAKPAGEAFADGKLRLQRQSQKRGGKAVIVIAGIAEPHEQLLLICKQLKQACACGGTVKQGKIELQNDQRTQVEAALQKLGYQSVWAGG